MLVLERKAGQTPDEISDPRDRRWQQTSTSASTWNEQRSGSGPEALALEPIAVGLETPSEQPSVSS